MNDESWTRKPFEVLKGGRSGEIGEQKSRIENLDLLDLNKI